jgi:hypothetical protein
MSLTNPYESRDCFRIWSPELENSWRYIIGNPINKLFGQLVSHYYDYVFQTFDSLFYCDKILASFLYPGHAREPEMITRIRKKEKRLLTASEINIANQLEITNCAEKSAYIASSQEIAIELDLLFKNYNTKKFYVGKDLINENFQGWMFYKVRTTKIPFYYRVLIDSGIYGRLMIEKVAREKLVTETIFQKTVKNKEELVLEGVSSLEGGLVTLFILCGVGIGLAVTAFGFECRRHIWESLITVCKRAFKVLKMLRQNYKSVLKLLKLLIRKRKSVKFRHYRKIHVQTMQKIVRPK